jgi:hypothetical protein
MNANSNVVYDVKGLVADLKAIEPQLKNQMVAEARAESVPAQSAIRQAIPSVAPLSGMNRVNNPSGRLAWGAGRPANQVKFGVKTTGSRRSAITPLFKLVVSSPMTAIADTAGKGPGVPRRLVTKPYSYRGEMRTHKINGQGSNMISVLRSRHKSNFVYPAVESSLPSVEAKLKLVVEKFALKVNRKLN